MKKNFCHWHFPCVFAREHRLIFDRQPEKSISYEVPCTDQDKNTPPPPDIASVEQTQQQPPPPEPKLDHMRFDMRRDEPTHIYNKKGEVIENSSDEIREMNSDEFKEHLHTMFTRHMSDQMKQERSRQIRLARGRRRAEARDLFPNRKERRAYEAGLLSNPDEIKAEAEAELAMIKPTPEHLYGAKQFDGMLDQITNAIWSSAEFQRGTVDYLKAYDKAWAMYIALGDQAKKGDSYIEEHPIFQSGAFAQKRAPGIYKNGELTKASSNYIGYRPVSTYGQAKIRERAGVSQNPEKDFLKKEEQVVRGGYESTWRNVFRRRNPLGGKAEEDAFVQKLVDQNLRKQGFRREQIDRSKLPDADHLRLPAEADRRTRQDYISAHDNLDARDRGAVVGAINRKLKLNVRSLQEFDKKMRLDEINLSSIAAGMPQVLHFGTKASNRRGQPVEGKGGLAIIDRSDTDAGKPTEVYILDFAAADRLLDDNPWVDGYLRSDEVTNTAEEVRKTFVTSLRTDNDIFNPGTYQRLIAVCRQDKHIPFALDELQKVCDVNERATRLGQKLKNIFIDTDVFKKGANWSDEHKRSFRELMQDSSSADRKLLKTLTRERCVYPNGDIDEKNFESFWMSL